jgi:hypothetical protein
VIVLRSLSVRGCIFFVVISFILYTSFSSYRNQKTRQEESVMGLRLRVMRGDEKDLSKMELEQNVHHQIGRFVCACTCTLIYTVTLLCPRTCMCPTYILLSFCSHFYRNSCATFNMFASSGFPLSFAAFRHCSQWKK